jgi:hypothetical protein
LDPGALCGLAPLLLVSAVVVTCSTGVRPTKKIIKALRPRPVYVAIDDRGAE